MKKEKKIILLNWYIILQPIIDILTSLGVRYGSDSITLGVAIRAVFVGIMAFYVMFIYRGKYEKAVKIYVAIISVYGLAFLANAAVCSGTYTIITNIKMFIKMYYFLYVLLGLFCMYQQYQYVVSDWLLVGVYCEYTVSIFLSAITNTSFGTYDYGKGYCGWFYAGNEVGAIISILAIVALFWAVKSKKKFVWISIGFLCAFSGTYVGTKVPLLASAMAVIVLGFVCLIQKILYKTSSRNIIRCVIILLAYCTLYMANSPVRQNNGIMVTEHYEESVVEKEEALENEENIQKNKAYLVINWLLSNRLVYVEGTINRYCTGTVSEKLLGLGYSYTVGKGLNSNLIEMDFLALLFYHGIVGLMIYILPICFFAVYCIRALWKAIKKIFENESAIVYTYGILIGLACAAVSGHVLIAPAVSIYIAILIIKLVDNSDNNLEMLR